MAALVDKASMAQLGSISVGLASTSSSTPFMNTRVKMPATHCAVGKAMPRNRSPARNPDRDRPVRLPSSRPEAVNPSLSSSMFGDNSRAPLPPSQRLDVARAAPVCDVPQTSDVSWDFGPEFGNEESLARAMSVGVEEEVASALGFEEWLTSLPEEDLSWQRSMLETHWLLDAQEREESLIREDQNDTEKEVAEVVEKMSEEISGTTQKRRSRRRQEKVSSVIEMTAVAPEERVFVKSSATARERRMQSRKQQPNLNSASGCLSNLNLQTAYMERRSARRAPGDSPSAISAHAKPFNSSLSSAGASTWQNQSAEEPSSTYVWSFMRDIGFAKLLTKEEEVELANTFQAAESLKQKRAAIEKQFGYEITYTDWAYEMRMTVNLLRQRLHAGERARERLIAANMRLVISVVKKYTRPGVSVADLITAGTMGLAKGIDRFDPSRGFKLSTYVHWWIRQAVTRAAADNMGAFRLPMHVHETLAKLKRIKADLTLQGKVVSSANIADTLGVSERRIIKLRKLKLNSKSLDEAVPTPAGFSEGSSFHNFIHDPEEDLRSWSRIEAILLKKDLADIMLNKLDARERDIICMHFGLNSKDGTGMTLDNIGLRYGVSRERIRQVETVAIRKLRALCAGKDLERYCY